ncbi:lysophospholipid acyltransferase family protein [bacterium]|jgi:KDO2-lipid IV(A) lauroyltransferase|nr:lysophospholipid acyltransferase family protein [bacterium]
MAIYHVYQLATFLTKRLSLPAARRTSEAAGRMLSVLQRRNRRFLYDNLRTAIGKGLSAGELRRLRSKVYSNFSHFVYNFMKLPWLTMENAHEVFTAQSLVAARALAKLASERPAILVTAHIGHWELGGALVALTGHPVAIFVDRHPDDRVTELFNSIRRKTGSTVVPITAFHRLFRELKRHHLVAIAGDRAVTGQGIRIQYFGRDYLAPDGYAALARRVGALIVPTFCIRQPNGLYDFRTGPPFAPPVTDDEDADVRSCVIRMMGLVEDEVRRYPEQWYVFRPAWESAGLPATDRHHARRTRARQSRPQGPSEHDVERAGR